MHKTDEHTPTHSHHEQFYMYILHLVTQILTSVHNIKFADSSKNG